MRALSNLMMAVTIAVLCPHSARAQQQVTVTTPHMGVRDSFYEHINLGWGLQRNWSGGSWFMNFGGPMSAIPSIGGYDPAADFRFGIAGRNSYFNFAASQGSHRSLSMVAPSVTMLNGTRGSIFSGSIRPFVTGLIPVVGDAPSVVPFAPYPQMGNQAPMMVSPLADRLERLRNDPNAGRQHSAPAASEKDLSLTGEEDAAASAVPASGPSTAERGDISVAEIRLQQQAEDSAKRMELDRLVAEAQQAEKAGHFALARVLYKQAAARADGKQRQELQETAAKLPTNRNASKR